MKIVVVSEHAGYELKNTVIKYLKSKGIKAYGYGAKNSNTVSYPQIAEKAALKIVDGKYELGIFICGTGIGMCISANKIPGIRAALCCNEYMSKMAHEHNNANVIALGSRVVGKEYALDIIDEFLKSKYKGGRHEKRLEELAKLEKKHLDKN